MGSPHADSLGSLLQGLDGIDTRAFSKPKTLAGMKSSKSNREMQVEATSVGLGTKEQRVISTPSPSNSPSISPSKPARTIVEPSSINNHPDSPMNTSTAAHIPKASPSSQHSTHTVTDSFFTTTTTTTTTKAQTILDQNPDDIFGNIEGGTSVTENVDAFDLFGGLPPQPSQPTTTTNNNNVKGTHTNGRGDFFADPEDLMAGFSQPTTTIDSSAQQPLGSQQQQRKPSNKYKVFDHIDAQPDYIDKHNNNNNNNNRSSSSSSLHPSNSHTPLGPLHSDDDESLSHQPPPPPPSHHHHHHAVDKPGEILAEAGQRAAKLLQTGTKWFMRTSKTIVQEVSTRIDHQRAKHGHHKDHHQFDGNSNCCTSGNNNNNNNMQGFYYEWAAQLARMSPGSRSAALCSLEEHDRMAVQLILDENARGEEYLSSSGQKQEPSKPKQSHHQQQQQQQRQDDADVLGEHSPPSYDQVIARSSKTTAAATTTSRKKSEPKQHQDGDDLLGLRSTDDTKKTSMEASLFGEDTPAAGPLDSMLDLGQSLGEKGGGTSSEASGAHSDLYTSGSFAQKGEADEPEERRILREKRLAAQAERMKRQLEEKRAREEAENAEKEGKRDFRDALKPKIDGWAAGKRDNIRALLSTLDQVLWPGSGWTKPSIADMVEDGKVKRVYMKANLIVHPDKVKQKGGTLEQITTADMVFDVLKVAWGKFETAR